MAGTSVSSLSSPIQTYALSRRPIRRYHRNRRHKPKAFVCYAAPPRSEQRIDETHKRKPEKDKPLRVLDWLKLDEIGLEIVNIALPAVLALAADPIASLVDTAFVGHLGSTELAAVGVSASVFNLVSKLFNVPLLNVTTSFVAEQQALDASQEEEVSKAKERRKYLPAVSTSLALAAGIGLLEAVALMLGSGFMMNAIGIPIDSPMRVPAEQFLTLRAYGAPPIVIALAAQGTFRGFKDTKTPLYAVGLGNLVNAILDAILILLLGLGVGGAAIATVTSEYLIAFILLWKLNEQVVLVSPSVIGDGVTRYLKSGGLLIGRTIAVLLTTTLATSLAAREGPVPMAGYQICLQVWLAVSLLNDALALAGQALLAGEYTKGNYKEARVIIYRVLQIGGITGAGLAVVLFFGFGTFSLVFTSDSQVLEIARSGLWFVTVSQPINAIAFVIDGLYYGVSDFAYAAYSMFLVGLVSSGFLLLVTPGLGLTGVWTGANVFKKTFKDKIVQLYYEKLSLAKPKVRGQLLKLAVRDRSSVIGVTHPYLAEFGDNLPADVHNYFKNILAKRRKKFEEELTKIAEEEAKNITEEEEYKIAQEKEKRIAEEQAKKLQLAESYSRCTEIKDEILDSLLQETGHESLESNTSMSVREFNKKFLLSLKRILASYDEKAGAFDKNIRKKLKDKLEEQTLQRFKPTFEAKIFSLSNEILSFATCNVRGQLRELPVLNRQSTVRVLNSYLKEFDENSRPNVHPYFKEVRSKQRKEFVEDLTRIAEKQGNKILLALRALGAALDVAKMVIGTSWAIVKGNTMEAGEWIAKGVRNIGDVVNDVGPDLLNSCLEAGE